MAKSSDDTNNSQFFITEGSSRQLDFNHSIFGQLVEGEDVRGNERCGSRCSDRPIVPVVIERALIVEDVENAVLVLKSNEGRAGTASVTVTARGAETGKRRAKLSTCRCSQTQATVDRFSMRLRISSFLKTKLSFIN